MKTDRLRSDREERQWREPLEFRMEEGTEGDPNQPLSWDSNWAVSLLDPPSDQLHSPTSPTSHDLCGSYKSGKWLLSLLCQFWHLPNRSGPITISNVYWGEKWEMTADRAPWTKIARNRMCGFAIKWALVVHFPALNHKSKRGGKCELLCKQSCPNDCNTM